MKLLSSMNRRFLSRLAASAAALVIAAGIATATMPTANASTVTAAQSQVAGSGTVAVPDFNKIFHMWKPVSKSSGQSGHDGWRQCGYYDYRNGPSSFGCSLTESTSNTWTGTLEVSLPVLDGFLNLGAQYSIGRQFSVSFSGSWDNAKKDKLIGYAAWTETYAVTVVRQREYICEQHHQKPICNNPNNYVPVVPATYKNVDVWIRSFRMTFIRCAQVPALGKECAFP